jgi:diguanylate cyclase (GGDEF)-like protein
MRCWAGYAVADAHKSDWTRVTFNWLAAEAGFDPLLKPYRVRADRIMVGMNVFLMLVCLALALLRATWLALALIGLPTLLMSWLMSRQHAGALSTRVFMASSFMVFTGLIIHQTGGDIEAHFSAFGLIGVLLYYRDWRTIAVATVVIYLHHLVLGYVQTLGVPIYVFDSNQFWLLFGIHVAYFLPFVGMMGYLSIWLRRDAFESQHVIALAERIAHGQLTDDTSTVAQAQLSPLVSAVLNMKNRLLDLLRVMPVAAAVIRIDTQTIVSVNAAWNRTFGTVSDVDEHFGSWPIWTEPQAWAQLMQSLQQASQKLLDKVEVVLRKTDGTPMLCELSLILHDGAVPAMAILTVEDISLRRKTEQTLQRMALRDMLTDLPNRASLQQNLAIALQQWQTKNIPFAVMMMDLDGFKPINDVHGHDVGDAVLRMVGARLTRINRSGDFAARLGGDEFVLVLHQCASEEAAAQAAQRIIDAVAQPIQVEAAGLMLQVGASAGVALINPQIASTDDLLKQADLALYAAKHAGKNQVARYSAIARTSPCCG